MKKVNIVVVDSGPIIKGADLPSFAKHGITVPGVIREIKDIKTRERMRNLPPYFFSVRQPSASSVSEVVKVSKQTGDFTVLSRVDIEVIALSYEITKMKENEIANLFEKYSATESPLMKTMTKNNDDFFFGAHDEFKTDSLDVTDDEDEEEDEEDEEKDEENILDNEIKSQSDDIETEEMEESSSNDEDEEEQNRDDGIKWITRENMHEHSFNNFCSTVVPLDSLDEKEIVGCLTTDYAAQNVLNHLKIPILSIYGMVVKELRCYVTYCRSCFRNYRKTEIYFCPHCGNDNLGRIPAAMVDGKWKLFFKKNYQPNLRNTKFSLPNPQKGKHTTRNTYIYCADQRLPQERAKKVREVDTDGFQTFETRRMGSRSYTLGIQNDRNGVLKPTRPKGKKRRR